MLISYTSYTSSRLTIRRFYKTRVWFWLMTSSFRLLRTYRNVLYKATNMRPSLQRLYHFTTLDVRPKLEGDATWRCRSHLSSARARLPTHFLVCLTIMDSLQKVCWNFRMEESLHLMSPRDVTLVYYQAFGKIWSCASFFRHSEKIKMQRLFSAYI